MLPVYALLFQLSSFFADIDLILKIVGLLLIMSFVRTHVQNGPLAAVLIVFLGAFLLFNGWGIFGTGLVAYLAVSFGVVGIIVDIFFFGGIMHRDPQEQQREEQAEHARQQHGQMNPELAAQLRARGISPEEYMEMQRQQGGGQHEQGHEEEEHDEHEGVASHEKREMMHGQHRAASGLQGFMQSQRHRQHRRGP